MKFTIVWDNDWRCIISADRCGSHNLNSIEQFVFTSDDCTGWMLSTNKAGVRGVLVDPSVNYDKPGEVCRINPQGRVVKMTYGADGRGVCPKNYSPPHLI